MTIWLRAQKVLIWWSIIMMTIYTIALLFLLHMVPPPTARWSAAQIAQFYLQHSTEVKLGAMIASWTSATIIPLTAVITVQVYRHEAGKPPIWSVLSCVGGSMMTIWIALPPLFFGVAAFTPGRQAEVTAIMHELGVLSLLTTDQFYIFLWVAVAVICLTPNFVSHSPFPRWFGYCTIWIALILECGAPAFLFRIGPFAWNGLMAFWVPIISFFIWLALVMTLLIRAINGQMNELGAATPNVAVSN
ncbi:MAG: hypothetical protein WB785_21420 [Mycobacterium sp.]|uniref:hypothetical protein n=1 Tax=Mycobacterium sp. TaxID=1785 RepID=UPI003C690504